MERRALIAVVLMFAVLLLYNMFFLSKRRQSDEAGPPETEMVATRPDTAEAPDLDAAGPELDIDAPVESVPASQVEVTTSLYSIRLTSSGGRIESFKLREYLSTDDMPLELVPDAEDLPLGLALLTSGGDRIDLSAAGFAPSSEFLSLEGSSERSLMFTLTTEQGLKVVKSLTFWGDSYVIGLDIQVSGPGSQDIRAVEVGWQSGLLTTEARVKDDLRNFAMIVLGAEGQEKVDLGKVKKREEIAIGGELKWSGLKTKYFFAGFVPLGGRQAVAKAFPRGEEAIGMTLEVDKRDVRQEFLLYVGPLDYEGLKQVGYDLERAVDFGWRWIAPLSRLMFRVIRFLHKIIPNYGLVIIVLSALTKLLFYPLTQKSFKSMRDMQRLQPELEALREKYKKDAKRLNEETMKLYRERGMNPLGGCLPMLLQMPVFIALFNVLSRTIELRRAPFVLWIQDLSAPDVVARLPFSLPFIGDAVSILPILMGVAMFVQQKMSTSDPKQKAMTYMLPVIFTVMFLRFPSGLVLYWLVNNLLTIGHQYLMARAERAQPA
jgi:YidC/Oxa1 family membrane protein insertase